MTNDEGTRSEDKEESKGKCQDIVTITRVTTQENIPSKGTIKRKTAEMMDVHKKEGCTLAKNPNKLMFSFWDSEKVGGTPNDIFPLVITSMVDHFDISWILIDGGSSCDIKEPNK